MPSEDKQAIARRVIAEALKRGGTLLSEPCPRCGGLMVRYKGRTFCPICDNVMDLDSLEAPPSPPAGLDGLESRILERVNAVLSKPGEDEKAAVALYYYLKALNELKKLKGKGQVEG